MIKGTTDSIFIHMSQLDFNPRTIETLLMEDSPHCVPNPISSETPTIADPHDNLIDTRFTYRLVRIIPPWKNRTIVPCILSSLSKSNA